MPEKLLIGIEIPEIPFDVPSLIFVIFPNHSDVERIPTK
jgi:hypothetical protein